MPELLPVFDKYFNEEDAENYCTLFRNEGLHPVLEPPSEFFDAIIGQARSNEFFLLRVAAAEFPLAKSIIEKEVKLRGIPEDHYLRAFKDAGLKDMLLNESDWSREDIAVGKILLEERGVLIDDIAIKKAKEIQKRDTQARQKISFPILLLFYIIAPLGALLPIVAGLIIYTMKDYDRDGEKSYVYSDDQRKHGLTLFAIGILSTILWLYYILSL